ncbi:MAG: AAA family ATPase [Desulfobacterota bacterium]|nr:AAA family ATPase [Thermodesulfobacteriota bacterium]MDW8002304.1 AAA family ATPase [Deltaproteobacteria bacterium]
MDFHTRVAFGPIRNPFFCETEEDIFYETGFSKEALEHLFFFLNLREGIALLIGEDGAGKTTVLKKFADRVADKYLPIFLDGKHKEKKELVNEIFERFINRPVTSTRMDFKEVLADIVSISLKISKELVLIVDDAHFLSKETLKFLLCLSGLEFGPYRLFHIILAGNWLLLERLKKKGMAEIVKRISVIHFMRPMLYSEAKFYINHRLNMALSLTLTIKEKALEMIFSESKGNLYKFNKTLSEAYCLAKYRRSEIIDEKIANLALESGRTDSKGTLKTLRVLFFVILYSFLFLVLIFGEESFLRLLISGFFNLFGR